MFWRAITPVSGKGRRHGDPPGKHRIIWMGLIPLYDNHILEWLENRLPIRFVWEEMWMFDHPNCPSPELSPGRYVASVFYAHLEDRLKGSLFYRPDSSVAAAGYRGEAAVGGDRFTAGELFLSAAGRCGSAVGFREKKDRFPHSRL